MGKLKIDVVNMVKDINRGLRTKSKLNQQILFCSFLFTLHKKGRFPLRISSVNATKSAGNYGFGRIY